MKFMSRTVIYLPLPVSIVEQLYKLHIYYNLKMYLLSFIRMITVYSSEHIWWIYFVVNYLSLHQDNCTPKFVLNVVLPESTEVFDNNMLLEKVSSFYYFTNTKMICLQFPTVNSVDPLANI